MLCTARAVECERILFTKRLYTVELRVGEDAQNQNVHCRNTIQLFDNGIYGFQIVTNVNPDAKYTFQLVFKTFICNGKSIV